MAKSVLIVFVLIFFQDLITCWVFTDMNSQTIRENSFNMDDDENEITPEETSAPDRLILIYPGTKWCGPGDIAENYYDLGLFAETDACCREHDGCPDSISAGQTEHNLTNTAFYTRLNCTCDNTFRKCLRAVNSKTSNAIGSIYFNALGTQCFRKDYPIIGCLRRGGFLNGKCLEYEYDVFGPQKYQWFDVPKY